MNSENPVSFKTIDAAAGPAQYRDRKSRFLGWAFPVSTEEEAAARLSDLRRGHPDAAHVCYAYRIGVSQPRERVSDDGEPAHSAGSPIFGQIEAAGLHNVLLCVVRYYGGVKLGVGGLIQAYREAARAALAMARVVTRSPKCILTLDFDYPVLDGVMSYISRHRLGIRNQEMGLRCHLELEIPLADCDKILEEVHGLGQVRTSSRTTY